MRRLVTWTLLLAVAVAACRIQPKGTLVFKIQGKREFDRVMLHYPDTGENRTPVRLKYIDTNTFQTSAGLAPGRYRLTMRAGDGTHLGADVDILPEVFSYDIPEPKFDRPGVSPVGSKTVRGRLSQAAGLPPEIVVVFIGREVIVRRTPRTGDAFVVPAPMDGDYRVEVHVAGTPPRSWFGTTNITGPSTDLGEISLK